MKLGIFSSFLALISLSVASKCAEEGSCATKLQLVLLQKGFVSGTSRVLQEDVDVDVDVDDVAKVALSRANGDNQKQCKKTCKRKNCKGKRGDEKKSCLEGCNLSCQAAQDSTSAAPAEPTTAPAEPTLAPAGEPAAGELPEPQYSYYISTGKRVHFAAWEETLVLEDWDCEDPSVRDDAGDKLTEACQLNDIAAVAAAACEGKFAGEQCEFNGPTEKRGISNYKSVCHEHGGSIMCFARRSLGCMQGSPTTATYSPPGARCISQWGSKRTMWTRGLSVCKVKFGQEGKTLPETVCKGGYNP